VRFDLRNPEAGKKAIAFNRWKKITMTGEENAGRDCSLVRGGWLRPQSDSRQRALLSARSRRCLGEKCDERGRSGDS